MTEEEKLDLYLTWFSNGSFFGNNDFVISNIEFLWKIINIIGPKFEYCINLEYNEFSKMTKEEIIDLVQKYYDKHNIDLKINELLENGELVLLNENKASDNFGISDGCSGFDENDNKIKAKVKLDNTAYDSLCIIHELTHKRNHPNNGRDLTSDILTEAVSYTNELIACDELLNSNDKTNYFNGFQKLIYNFAYNLYNIYKVILIYKYKNDITEEKYNLEFNDKNYTEVMKDFDNYVNETQSIYKHSYYVLGFALSIYMFEKYKNSNDFFNKIEELNNSINNKDFNQCLQIIDIDNLDDLLVKFGDSASKFINIVGNQKQNKL